MVGREEGSRESFRVFVSYRRADASGHAGRLYDRLVEQFGAERLFWDIDAIRPGTDFVQVIDRALDECDVFLALVGNAWLQNADRMRRRRLDNPDDFVRVELEAALRRRITIIPVLLQGAEMPSREELPSSLAAFARRQAFELSDRRWQNDVKELIEELERLAQEKARGNLPREIGQSRGGSQTKQGETQADAEPSPVSDLASEPTPGSTDGERAHPISSHKTPRPTTSVGRRRDPSGSHQRSGSAEMARASHRALLIANSTFTVDPANFPELKGPKYDLAVIWQALTHPRLGLFRRENVVLIPERNYSQITTTMERFFRAAGPDDQLLLYYSGHGDLDIRSNFYLCASDTRKDQLLATGVSDVLIRGLMDESSARSLVVILDCCFSGAAFKGSVSVPNLKGSGRFILQSSGADEVSKDAARETDASAFTHYLAEALVSGDLDGDGDGYVAFDDVYNYVSGKLEPTGQIVHRKADGAGTVKMAKALRRTALRPPDTGPPHHRPPVLKLSRHEIELHDVPPDGDLAPEIVEVFNAGGGTLDWMARSEVSWIDVETGPRGVTLRLAPRPGMNHGLVRVDDRKGGGSQVIRVVVNTLLASEAPRLAVSETELDFGVVSQRGASPQRTVQVVTTPSTKLAVQVRASDPWIEVRHFGDAIIASVATTNVGTFAGEILVESAAGSARIAVKACVEAGPLLSVEPSLVDFGEIETPEGAERDIRVRNLGRGDLTWQCGTSSEFFTLERAGEGMRVHLVNHPGCHIGSIWVRSNGGEANIDVRADVKTGKEPRTEPSEGLRPAQQSPRGPMVHVHLKDRQPVFDPGQTVTIGRHTDCDVVCDNQWVSRTHAELRWNNGRWVLTDLGSKEGIFADDQRVEAAEVRGVKCVWLGPPGQGQRLVLVAGRTRTTALADDTRPPGQGEIRVRCEDRTLLFSSGRTVTIGRNAECDVKIDNPYVSGVHAELKQEADGWWLIDRESSRGTFHQGLQVQRLDIDAPTTVCLGPTDCGTEIVLVPGPTAPPLETLVPPTTASTSNRRKVLIWAAVVVVICLLMLL